MAGDLRIEPRRYRGLEAETIRFTVPMRRPDASGEETLDARSTRSPEARFQPSRAKGVSGDLAPSGTSASSASRLLTLECVRLRAVADRPGDPIVFLTGGPGMSAIRQGEGRLFPLFDSLRRFGDVLLLDQRGCGCSAPAGFALDDLALPDRALDRDEVLRAVLDHTRAAADRLRDAGMDIGAFTTMESAADVADLVQALYGDHARVALLAWSYGTHLAMAIMRAWPSLVSRAVLAGPEGPDHTYKLPSRIQRQVDDLARMTRDDDVLGALVPDLVTTMARALDRVETEPVRVRTSDPVDVWVGRFELEWMISAGIADTQLLRRLPLLLSRLERGDGSMLSSDPLIVRYLRGLRTGLAESIVRPCVDCASGASAARRARIEHETPHALLGRMTDFPFPEICAAVGSPDLGDDFRTPERSEIPVLFVTGTLDCRTPADNVEDLAGFFPNRRHLVVDGAGHGDLLTPGAARREIERFLREGAIDADRVATDTPFAFEHPRPIVLYDGECGFCRTQVEGLRRRAGETVEFAPFQDAPLPAGVTADALRRSMHMIRDDGEVVSGARAVFEAIAIRSGRHPLLWMYERVPGFAPLAEWAYRWVARNRHRLGGE